MGSSWRQANYCWFGAGELPQLEKFLRPFPGLIIGYNLFDFDYRVLHPHIPLEGIVEKTVDLRLLLDSLHSSQNVNLKLASLARINLMRRKLHDSRKMPALWRAGKRQFVLSHNKRDRELTAELWMYLLQRRRVEAAGLVGVGTELWLTLSPKALRMLAGRTRQLTCREWLARIEEWGNAVHPLPTVVHPGGPAQAVVPSGRDVRLPLLQVCCPSSAWQAYRNTQMAAQEPWHVLLLVLPATLPRTCEVLPRLQEGTILD